MALDTNPFQVDTEIVLQLSFNKMHHRRPSLSRTLAEMREGEEAILEQLDLPEDMSRRLMEMGFVPGHIIAAGRSAPGGCPQVFRVDGSEVALRKETAKHMKIRHAK